MANHGYCKNCWWYLNNGCYMQMVRVTERDYCPDYTNRKNHKDNLFDWITEKKIEII